MGGGNNALCFQVLSYISRPWPIYPPFLTYGNIENFLKNNTSLYCYRGAVTLGELPVNREQQLQLSAKHNSHTHSYCAKCFVKGPPASVSTSESSNMRSKRRSVPEVKLLSETIRRVLLVFLKGEKENWYFSPGFHSLEQSTGRKSLLWKKGDILTEANKVNRQLTLFPNTWQMKTLNSCHSGVWQDSAIPKQQTYCS